MATRDLRPPSILLVSNSVDEREVYTRALRASGYRVVNAATTVLAYQIAITQPTDIVVVTDGHCAGSMSGLALTRRLRIHTCTATVPILVITSETRRQDGELSIKTGADMFLEKPVSGDVLREHVVRLLVACGRLPRQLSPKHERLSSVRDNTHLGTERTCPMSWTHRRSAQVTGPLGGGSEQLRATTPVARCVRLVLYRPGVRVPGVTAAQGITR
jgi:two-component system chemotaxis response regulator CheY